MASKLTQWINSKLKAKGMSAKEAQKNAGKYSSIAAAKKAGSLYYTDKKGRVMIAAYAEDLKAPIKSPPPKKRPKADVKSNRKAERNLSIAKTRLKLGDSEAASRQALAKIEKTKAKLKKLDDELAALNKKKKKPSSILGGKANATTMIIVKGPKGPLKRKANATDNEVSNEQLKQKGGNTKGSRVVEAGDRYRKPGQGRGRGLRGTNPEEPFSGKTKYKRRKRRK